MWKPDPTNEEPLFRQIARHFEALIIRGSLSPGAPLPPERKLAQQLAVNRSTITEAYAELRASGLVQSRQGRGTWISEHQWGVSHHRLPNWHDYTTGGTFFPMRPLQKRIQEMQRNPALINMVGGEMHADLTASHLLNRQLNELVLPKSLGYLPPAGDEELRQTLSEYLSERHGISATPDEIMITSGGQQALHLITQCLLKPGDAIALEGPSYGYSLRLFPSAGLRLFRIPLDDQGLLPEEVATLYRKHKIRLVIANPTYQNPTGTVLSLKRRKRLLEICESVRIPIIEDDAYGALTLDGTEAPPPSLLTLSQGRGLVLYIGSFSKTIAAGLRIGWLVAPASVIERFADVKKQIDYGTGTISQKLINSYLRSGEWNRQLKHLQTELTRRRDIMCEALDCYASDLASWNTATGGYHIWCRLKQEIPEGELIEKAIAHGILFSPGGVYGAEPGYVRLSYASSAEQSIDEGIRRFGAVLQAFSTVAAGWNAPKASAWDSRGMSSSCT